MAFSSQDPKKRERARNLAALKSGQDMGRLADALAELPPDELQGIDAMEMTGLLRRQEDLDAEKITAEIVVLTHQKTIEILGRVVREGKVNLDNPDAIIAAVKKEMDNQPITVMQLQSFQQSAAATSPRAQGALPNAALNNNVAVGQALVMAQDKELKALKEKLEEEKRQKRLEQTLKALATGIVVVAGAKAMEGALVPSRAHAGNHNELKIAAVAALASEDESAPTVKATGAATGNLAVRMKKFGLGMDLAAAPRPSGLPQT